MTVVSGIALANGAFTPALRSLALDVMDALVLRPAAVAISDPSPGPGPSFRSIRDRLTRKKYTELTEWKADVAAVLNAARASGDATVAIVCEELDRWFSKRYDHLFRLSEFKFRDALLEAVDQLKQARDAFGAAQ
jgi:hypothetical protein